MLEPRRGISRDPLPRICVNVVTACLMQIIISACSRDTNVWILVNTLIFNYFAIVKH